MRYDLFSIPIFVDQVDLTKIQLTETGYDTTWLSDVKTNYLHQPDIHPDTFDYLSEIIDRHLSTTGKYKNPTIGSIWRNLYSKTDTQEVHIHAGYQWSFIIYETVQESKTVFLNPAWKTIENQMGIYAAAFPMHYRPRVGPGTIIIFPSFIEHHVLAGNEGSTIAGNIKLEYVDE